MTLKKFVLGFGSVLLLALAVSLIIYFSTTMSMDQCVEYCKENSEVGNTTFANVTDTTYKHAYSFWIATDVDVDENEQQELFIFRKSFFGKIDFHRYKLYDKSIYGISGEDLGVVGYLQLFLKDDSGEKEPTATLFLFGSEMTDNSDHVGDPTHYTYTLETDDGSNTFEGHIAYDQSENGSAWMNRINGITETAGIKKVVSNFVFYDDEDNVVAKIE